MILGFHHAAISTPDLDRSISFYKDVVGCEEAWSFEWPVGTPAADEMTGLTNSAARAVMLKLGETYLEVFAFSSPAPQQRTSTRPVCDHGITHICLLVENLHSEYERMRSAVPEPAADTRHGLCCLRPRPGRQRCGTNRIY